MGNCRDIYIKSYSYFTVILKEDLIINSKMGCDFYTYYVVRIEYKDGDKIEVKSEEIEGTRERHYFWEIDDMA